MEIIKLHCGNNKVMKFEYGIDEQYYHTTKIWYRGQFDIHGQFHVFNKGNNEITDSLNIKYIEHITEEDCPKCKGMSPISKYDCEKCNITGRIEKVTSFTVFGKSRKEHDGETALKITKPLVEQIMAHFANQLHESIRREINYGEKSIEMEIKEVIEELSEQESE